MNHFIQGIFRFVYGCRLMLGVTGLLLVNVPYAAATAYIPPSITVVSPNGAESLSLGSTYTIRWTSKAIAKYGNNIKIVLKEGSVQKYIVATNISNIATSYVWTVPLQGVLPGNYTIEVSYNLFAGARDVSNAPFMITACVPNCSATGVCGGTDSCGGICQTGTCSAGQVCNIGVCVVNSYSLVTSSTMTTGGLADGSFTFDPVVVGNVYPAGSTVSVTAHPNSGYQFGSWTVTDNGVVSIVSSNPLVLTMDGNKTVLGSFTVPAQKFQVYTSDTMTNGGVSLDPVMPEGGYTAGTPVNVTATPNSGYQFSSWLVNNVNVGSANPLLLTMDSDKFIVGNFTLSDPQVQALYQQAQNAINLYNQNPTAVNLTAAKNAVEAMKPYNNINGASGVGLYDELRHQLSYILHYKAQNAINQYNQNPTTANLALAQQAVALLQPYNDIQVGVINILGLYDDAVTRLIQMVKNKLAQTKSISTIPNSSEVVVEGGRIFVQGSGNINVYRWNALTQQKELINTIPPPSGITPSWGYQMFVKGNTLVVYALSASGFLPRLYVYKFDSALNQWKQQTGINQKSITGSSQILDYLDLGFLVNKIGFPLKWAFTKSTRTNLDGEFESIGLVISTPSSSGGAAYTIDHQLAYKNNQQNPISPSNLWTIKEVPGFLGKYPQTVALDGNFAVMSESDSSNSPYKLHILRSKIIANPVIDEWVFTKVWQEVYVVNLGKNGSNIAVAINEEAVPIEPNGMGTVRVVFGAFNENHINMPPYSSSQVSGTVYTMTGTTFPEGSFFPNSWSQPEALDLVIPFTVRNVGMVLAMKNKNLVVNAFPIEVLNNSSQLLQLPSLAKNLTELPPNPTVNPNVVLSYRFDSYQNKWLWAYSLYKNRISEYSTNFGYKVDTDGTTVGIVSYDSTPSPNPQHEVTVINPRN